MLQLSRLHMHCFIAYSIRQRIFYAISNLTVLVKTDIKIPVCLKKDLSVCIKFLLIIFIINAHLLLQNSIHLHFLHLHPHRNDLPKTIDFKINKQRINKIQVTAIRRIHFNFLSNLLK